MIHATITVGFETSHRLAHFGDECASLHGHSWRAHITVSAPEVGTDGTVVDFHPLREAVGGWVAKHLNHACMLAADDPLAPILAEHQCRVYLFGATAPRWWEAPAADLPYPTVENVARLLARVAEEEFRALRAYAAPGAEISTVVVDEAPGSQATWTRR